MAGRYLINITFGVPGVVSDLAAIAVGFTVRLQALYRGWEGPPAKEPEVVYYDCDERPLLGRKVARKSRRALRDLGPLPGDARRCRERRGADRLHGVRRPERPRCHRSRAANRD
jgi:hypothetical protein